MSEDDKPKAAIIMGTGAGGMRALTGAGQAEVKKAVEIKPAFEGQHGQAWICDLPALLNLSNLKPEDDACLRMWIVEAPWAHPVWHSYLIYLVHLRDMPDQRPTIFHVPDATHEFVLYAMDPDADREAVITGRVMPFKMCLQPVNFAAQLVEIRDDLAIERIEAAIRDICDGKLSPDTDAQSQWIERFGNNMIKKEWR